MYHLPASILRTISLFFITFISCASFAQTNNACSFDGTDDYVSTSAYVVPTSGDFTVEFWAYATVYSGYQEFVSQGSSGSAFYMGITGTGEIRCGDNWGLTGITMPLNQWVHIALVKSGGSATLFLDGIQKAALGSGYAISSAGSNFQMGTQYGGIGEFFKGNLDEMRIWNVARTQADIKANMFNKNMANDATGLIAYYRFNEGSGTSTANSGLNTAGMDGNLVNGVAWTNSPVQFGSNAVSFDGIDDYVVSTPTFNLNMNNSSFTVETWINSANSSANSGTERILLQWGSTWQAGAYQLVCTNSYINFNFNGSSTGSCTYNVNWQDGNWHHLAGVFDISSHTLYLYFDGVQRAAVSTAGNVPGALNGSLFIGGSPDVANSFTAVKMDDVRVWNVARSQSDIQANMYGELNHPFSNVGTVPRLYYTFNQGVADGDNTGLVTVNEQYLQAHGNGTLVNFAFSGASNYVAQNTDLFVLPLQWHEFTVERRDRQVQMEWSTDQELTTQDFAVQHSNDGHAWNTLGVVMAGGNSNSIRYYSYMHNNPASGINYYRIRANDLDGKYSYSEVKTVRLSDKAGAFTVISNPVEHKRLHLLVHDGFSQAFYLFDVDGKMIWTKKFSPGMHWVDLALLPGGVYLLQSAGKSQKLVIK